MRTSFFGLLAVAGLAAGGPFTPALPQQQQQCSSHQSAAENLWCRLRGGGSCFDCTPPAPVAPPTLLSTVKTWHPVLLALLGTSFGWFMTALGSAATVIHKLGLSETTYRKVLDFMLGISGGVMTAASYWSLLAPALDFAELQGWGQLSFVPVALGFLSGGALLQGTDWWLSRMQGSLEDMDLYQGLAVTGDDAASKGERISQLRRLLLLILAITIHNFPEGMAVGVAFGAIGSAPGATFGSAATLALGIGIQNFPEGLAVSMPLMRQGVSPLKSFWYGQLSGMVEPIGGVLGAAFVHYCRPMLPYTMSLAAGAMIFVVCDSLVPEMQARPPSKHLRPPAACALLLPPALLLTKPCAAPDETPLLLTKPLECRRANTGTWKQRARHAGPDARLRHYDGARCCPRVSDREHVGACEAEHGEGRSARGGSAEGASGCGRRRMCRVRRCGEVQTRVQQLVVLLNYP